MLQALFSIPPFVIGLYKWLNQQQTVTLDNGDSFIKRVAVLDEFLWVKCDNDSDISRVHCIDPKPFIESMDLKVKEEDDPEHLVQLLDDVFCKKEKDEKKTSK
eukprot:15348242-Ditylum_brightwellii.AAC.1